MNRENIDNVLRSLRKVNLQGSFLGQTVAIRFGLSESDIETIEQLIDMGASTAGKLAEVTGLTSGAVTRVLDRLEQAGYVRRVPDPTDRRRVIVEVVPEKVAAVQSTLNRVSSAGAEEIGRYTDAQLALIGDFLTRMEQVARAEATTLRDSPEVGPDGGPSESGHSAPLGGLHEARLTVRSGLSSLRLQRGANPAELYRAAFEGATPQVRLRDGRVLVQYRGVTFDWRKRTAAIDLNPAIPWTIDVLGGVQDVQADLRKIDLRRFELVGGVERILIGLAAPHGAVGVRIVGGVKTARIERPKDTPVRLSVLGGTGQVTVDGMRLDKRGGQTSLETPGYATATDRIQIEVSGGSHTIEIVGRG